MKEPLERALGTTVRALVRVPGGDLNDAYRAELADGRVAFVKSADDAAPGAFGAEAAGLRWLAEPDGALPVPAPLAYEDARPGFLALAWVDEGRRGPRFAEELGRGLAALHAAGAPTFGATPPGTPAADDGAPPPTRLGPIVLPNDAAPTWSEFYGAARVLPLTRMAADRGALPDGAVGALERVVDRLPALVGPEEPPARLHGDLWSGNVMAGPEGGPWLIDPAAYGGHREIDLAMLQLFGAPGPRCFAAYDEVLPRADGHEERVELNQLLPLLVHAVLFGGGYGTSVARAAARYV